MEDLSERHTKYVNQLEKFNQIRKKYFSEILRKRIDFVKNTMYNTDKPSPQRLETVAVCPLRGSSQRHYNTSIRKNQENS